MKKTILLFVLIGAMLLAACTPATPTAAPAEPTTPSIDEPEPTAVPDQPTDEPASGAVEITFWSWVPKIEDQVAAFNASQSAIKVNYVRPAGGREMYNQLKVALQANADIPDV